MHNTSNDRNDQEELTALQQRVAELEAKLQVCQRQLAESEKINAELMEMFDSIGDTFFGVDFDWQFRYLNVHAVERSGAPLDQMVGKSLWEAFPQLLGTVYETHYRRAMTERIQVQFEAPGLLSGRWYNVSVYPTGSGLAVYARNISTQKELARQVETDQAHLEAVLQHIPAGVIIAEAPSGKLLLGNQLGAELLGQPFVPAETIDAYGAYEGFHPDGSRYQPSEWPLARAITKGETVIDEEIAMRRTDGTRAILSVSAAPVRTGDGEVVAGVAIFHDVTKRKEIEEALRLSEERFAKAFRASPDGLAISRQADGRILEVNGCYEEITGYGHQELVGRNSLDLNLYVDPDDRRKGIEKIRQEGFLRDYELPIRTKSGEIRHVRLSVEPINVSGEACFLTIFRDVSAQKQAAEERERLLKELDEQRALLDTILDQLPIGVSIAEAPSGRSLYQNQEASRLLGHSLIEGESYQRYEGYNAIHEDGTPYAPEEYPTVRAALHGEIIREEEMVYQRGNGRTTLFSVSSAPVVNAEGSRIAAVSTFYDISERKAAEEALRERERAFTTLANSIPQLAWMTDAHGWIFWYNQRWYDYTGTTLEEVEGWGWQKVHHPDHVDRVVASIKRSFETGEPWEDTFPLRSKEGEYRWFLSRALPIHDDEGNVVRWFGTNTDITEKLEMEQALREREQRLSLATDAAGLGIFEWNVQAGSVVWENERMYEIFGRSSEEAPSSLEEFKRSILHPQDRATFERDLAVGVKQGGPWNSHFRMRRADGTLIWVETTGRIEVDAVGNPQRIVGVMADVTARKQAEAERERLLSELAQERAQLQELTQTLEARVAERTEQVQMLAARLSLAEHQERKRVAQILHDHVQQMLYGVQWRTYMIQTDLANENISSMKSHVEEMKWLTDEAVRAARTLTVELSPPVLESEGLPEAVTWLANQMQELHALTVTIETEGDCRVTDKNLRVLIFQIVRELLFNVVKHAETDRAHVALRRENDWLIAKVRDHGQGFEVDRLDGGSNGQSGFGLFNARKRLGLFGGRIQIDSLPGKGTEVTITLPLADAERRESSAEAF